MRFGHLVEYNVNTYFEKSYRESGGEAGHRSFYKNSKLNLDLWINNLKY